MKKGAIFDLDGTLVSSPNLHIRAWKKLFEIYHITPSEEELREQSGMKNISYIQTVLARRNIKNLDSQKLSDQKDQIVITCLKKKPALVFPEVKEFLKLLKLKGVKLALATSASRDTALVLGKQVVSSFDCKIFAEDVSKGKPDPEIFLKAAKCLGLKSSDCVVFEDTESGVSAAKAGNFYCVARDNKLGDNLNSADLIVEKYNSEELIKYFTT